MRLVVCLKAIPDPEIPPRDFRLEPGADRPALEGVALVISPFDENALELALQCADRDGSVEVTALTVGGEAAEEMLRKALALGAREAIRVEPPGGAEGPGAYVDASVTAALLAGAVARLGGVDLVLCGRQAGDWDQGVTGPLLACRLGWPYLPVIRSLELAGGEALGWRDGPGGEERWGARLPAVATVTNDAGNQLRLAKVREIMQAYRKPLYVWPAAELGLGGDVAGDAGPGTELVRLERPPRAAGCEWVRGDSAAERGRLLAERLAELGAL